MKKLPDLGKKLKLFLRIWRKSQPWQGSIKVRPVKLRQDLFSGAEGCRDRSVLVLPIRKEKGTAALKESTAEGCFRQDQCGELGLGLAFLVFLRSGLQAVPQQVREKSHGQLLPWRNLLC